MQSWFHVQLDQKILDGLYAAALTPFMEKDPCTSPLPYHTFGEIWECKEKDFMATFHAKDYGHLMKASRKHWPNVLGQNRQTAQAKVWGIFASTLSTHFVTVRP